MTRVESAVLRFASALFVLSFFALLGATEAAREEESDVDGDDVFEPLRRSTGSR